MKYLYGLSIQGIQNYIFETSKLKEIIGASNIVSNLLLNVVKDIMGNVFNEQNVLMNAAGKFKYIFDQKDQLNQVFREVPKAVYLNAGDITVSQAYVELPNDQIEKEDLSSLEEKLKVQRNIQWPHRSSGFMAGDRVPRTGNLERNDDLDHNQVIKNKSHDKDKRGLLNKIIDDEAKFNDSDNLEVFSNDSIKNWIAVIHADGNALGKKILKMNTDIQDRKNGFKAFSQALQDATEQAVKEAFETTLKEQFADSNLVLPFRPIIIGGDDITVIIRADFALPFTKAFLAAFESKTKEKLSEFCVQYKLKGIFSNGLTACAGIAFIKTHYPIHYGVRLAEILCQQAKKDAKQLDPDKVPSCLMFHQVHSSFVGDWKNIKDQELKSGEVSFVYGPYYLDVGIEGRTSIEQLIKWAEKMNSEAAPKSNIRQWLSMLAESNTRAKDILERTQQIIKSRNVGYLLKDLGLNEALTERIEGDVVEKVTHLYDVLTIAEIQPKND